jgi:hypothetical protein
MIRFLQTQGPTKKIILSSLLLIICGGMVITLIPGGLGSDILGQPSTGVVAKVAGQNITTQEVRDRARALAEQQVAQYGPMGKQLLPMIMPRAISQSVEQLITGKAIVAEADRMGLKATDEDVRDELQHGRYAATLFPNGKFIGDQAYANLLQQANLTVSAFEADVKNEILEQKLAELTPDRLIASAWTVTLGGVVDQPNSYATSNDGGLSWSAPRFIGTMGQTISVVPLHDDRVMLLYNRRYGEQGIVMALALNVGWAEESSSAKTAAFQSAALQAVPAGG